MVFMKKSALAVLLLCCLFSVLPAPAVAGQSISVGIYEYKPLVFLNGNGRADGFFVDVFNHIAANEEWMVTYRYGSWQEGIDRLERGEIDLLLCVGYSEERAERYDFTSESLLTDWGVVYRRNDRQINTIMDLEGKTVAVLKGSIFTLGFRQLASQFNVNVTLVEMSSVPELFSAEAYGVADAAVTGNMAGFGYTDDRSFRRTPVNFSPVKLGIAALQGHKPALIETLNRRLKSLKEDKNSVYNRKLEELSSGQKQTFSPILLWGLALLGAALLVAVAFVITLTRIVQHKTEKLKSSGREVELREEQFRLAMDASRDGLWDWNIVSGKIYFSPGYFRMLGYEPSELKHELSTWTERLHPDDHDDALKAHTECIEGSTESFAVEFRMLAKNGDWTWILGRGAAVARRDDGRATRMLGTHTDITGLVAARNALRASEERLKLATAAAHMGVWDWSLQSNILVWDEKVFAIYGVDPVDHADTKMLWEQAIHEEDRVEVIEKLDAALKAADFYDAEYRIVRPDETVRSIKSSAAIIREDGVATRITGVDIDVTERRALEQQISQSQKMDAIGRLAGGVAHDFNNKLTVILGYAELMKMLECTVADRCDQYLDEIVKAAHHSQEITRKLLAFSRSEAAESCRLDLNYLLSEIERTLGRLIGEQIEIQMEKAADLWPVKMNPTEYDQIIMNLVVNARDAMPDGGKIFIRTGNATVDHGQTPAFFNAPGDYVITAVTDTGSGISKEIMERIFDPFFTTKAPGKGTGLGLSTVYGIVSKCQGFILVDSEPGKGSTFKVYLPRFSDTSAEAAVVEEMEEIRGVGVILLVEDERAVREMSQLFLESIGYRVIAAATPLEAISICEDETNIINCVLSDVVMPGMNGKQLQEQINLIRPSLPFVFMSGYTSDILTEQGVMDQGLHFIRKPLNFKLLHDKLAQLTCPLPP
jgi:PAS domain S-box-containing protein